MDNDMISRQAAIDAIYHHLPSVSRTRARTMLHEVPSVQPEKRMETHACDLIDRQAAIDAQEAYMADHQLDGYEDELALIDILRNLPSAQPDIIRCGDCKWYGRADKRRFYRGMDCLQKRIDTIVPDRDFCSKAERRTDD